MAISESESLLFRSIPCALLIRLFNHHLYGGSPVEALKARANCDCDKPTRRASSSRPISCLRCDSRNSSTRLSCHLASPLSLALFDCVWAPKRAAIRAIVRLSPYIRFSGRLLLHSSASSSAQRVTLSSYSINKGDVVLV